MSRAHSIWHKPAGRLTFGSRARAAKSKAIRRVGVWWRGAKKAEERNVPLLKTSTTQSTWYQTFHSPFRFSCIERAKGIARELDANAKRHTVLPASHSRHYPNPGVFHARFFFCIVERSRESVNVQSINMILHVYGRDNYVVNDVNIRIKNRNTLRVINFPVANFRENSIYGSSDFGLFFNRQHWKKQDLHGKIRSNLPKTRIPVCHLIVQQQIHSLNPPKQRKNNRHSTQSLADQGQQ